MLGWSVLRTASRRYFPEMVDEATPDGVGCENGDLLTHNGTDERLKQVVTTGDALWPEFLNHGAEQGILAESHERLATTMEFVRSWWWLQR